MYIAFPSTEQLAAGVKIGEALTDGEIEITEAQYLAAIDSVVACKMISIDDGEITILDAPQPPESMPEPPSADHVDAECQRRISVGRSFNISGITEPIAIRGDAPSQLNLLALKDTARDLKDVGVSAPVVPVPDVSDEVHMLTPDQVIELVNAGKIYIQSIYAAARSIKSGETIPDDFVSDSYWPNYQ